MHSLSSTKVEHLRSVLRGQLRRRSICMIVEGTYFSSMISSKLPTLIGDPRSSSTCMSDLSTLLLAAACMQSLPLRRLCTACLPLVAS